MPRLPRLPRLRRPRLSRTTTVGSVRDGRRRPPGAGEAPGGAADVARRAEGYPGDYDGVPVMERDPGAGSDPVQPVPGEVVWTWVPYEEDHARGKDRPVLLVGHDGPWLLGLALSSVDHDRDEDQERAAGRHWVDVGSGDWDTRRRRSEARVDRVVRVDPAVLRREGGSVDARVFTAVAEAVRAVAEGRGYDDDPA